MDLWLPGRIISGRGCVRKNKKALLALGSKPLIVCSRSSHLNGSYEDVVSALGDVEFATCDAVPANPKVSDMDALAEVPRREKCDYVIAIGGGSVIDSAKAIAMLSANNIDAKQLYAGEFVNPALPIAAIPTTCGSGSEVTSFSVLETSETKLSFASDSIGPKLALLDAGYLETLPLDIVLDTALDAVSHAAEGYIIHDSAASDLFAEGVFATFAKTKDSLLSGHCGAEVLEMLLTAALYGGVVISMTRTSAVHAMSYAMTAQRGIPHGRACCSLLGQYVLFSHDAKPGKIDRMCRLMGVEDPKGFVDILNRLMPDAGTYTLREVQKFTQISADAAVSKKNPREMTTEDVLRIFSDSLKIS